MKTSNLILTLLVSLSLLSSTDAGELTPLEEWSKSPEEKMEYIIKYLEDTGYEIARLAEILGEENIFESPSQKEMDDSAAKEFANLCSYKSEDFQESARKWFDVFSRVPALAPQNDRAEVLYEDARWSAERDLTMFWFDCIGLTIYPHDYRSLRNGNAIVKSFIFWLLTAWNKKRDDEKKSRARIEDFKPDIELSELAIEGRREYPRAETPFLLDFLLSFKNVENPTYVRFLYFQSYCNQD